MRVAESMLNGLVIFIGSGFGGVLRWWLGGVLSERVGSGFPWATLIVNVTGSFAIGLVGTLTGPDGRILAPTLFRSFFMVGVCGGYTTFSSFSLQTLNLAEQGQWARAGANVLLSVVLCLLGVWLGHSLAATWNASKSP